jgi:FkbM family methyltransferase
MLVSGLKKFAQLHLDYRAHRGLSEFSFRSSKPSPGAQNVRITSHDGVFDQVVALRSRTSDWATFRQVFLGNDYNMRRLTRWHDIESRYQNIVRTGSRPLILDLGANIGLSSLYLVKNWPNSTIYSIEPDKDNFELLRANTSEVSSIKPILAAIANRDGKAFIRNPDADAWAFQIQLATADSTSGNIDAISVNSLIQSAAHNERVVPFIVKIDIEGFEQDLFASNLEWLPQFYVVIIELHDWMLPGKASSKNFLRAISRLDRDFLFHGENIFSIMNGDNT